MAGTPPAIFEGTLTLTLTMILLMLPILLHPILLLLNQELPYLMARTNHIKLTGLEGPRNPTDLGGPRKPGNRETRKGNKVPLYIELPVGDL